MFELVYQSNAIPDLTTENIERILEVAQNFNSKNNISGCLFYHDHKFLQLLEGDEEVVRNLFNKICQNKFHSKVELLTEGFKEERTFEKWKMAYVDLSSDHKHDKERELFVLNFLAYSELIEKPSPAIKEFWKKVRDFLEKRPMGQ
ncbi:MAG: BLUF domain-containing protein [Reichenbachiella sp.]|uniref:BLUF domain-containing protein n=1 Tax=Reichenbachiella sp. TaxID=2184521 RepID=UPI0032664794